MRTTTTIHGHDINRIRAESHNVDGIIWVDLILNGGDSGHEISVFASAETLRQIADAINAAVTELEGKQ